MNNFLSRWRTHQDERGTEEDEEEAEEDEGQSATDVPATPPPVDWSQTFGQHIRILLEPLQRERERERERGGGDTQLTRVCFKMLFYKAT